jgi:hypothetical protein
MTFNVKNQFALCLTIVVISTLSSCGPVTPVASPTPTPPQPTASQTQPAETSNESSYLQAGRRYGDISGDMEVSFLDVVGFQAAVNEQSEILEVVFQLRDIPSTATRRQIRNQAEYMWEVQVFLDPSELHTADAQFDYLLTAMTVETDPPTGQEILTPVPGTPEVVPIHQLWDQAWINNQQGDFISGFEPVMDPDSDTITFQARLPDITSKAGFRFATIYYDGVVMDRPDMDGSSESTSLSTPLPEATPTSQLSSNIPTGDTTQLIPTGPVRAYPGPEHYAGDVLTFEIKTDSRFDGLNVPVLLSLDGRNPNTVEGKGWFDQVLVPLALDTTNLTGRHTLRISTADGDLNETYSFEVLPFSERPANEVNAAWVTTETACCEIHYISDTAAARDIEFITEHFQQAAEEFATITGKDIDPKLKVYIMDRIWGNGGFGGNGELVISYTDRYYGPTVGGEGLETLARHEFTHAAGIDTAVTGDGVAFNYEGLAVYVAGGHYKPEPLAERGAALFDLGHYVPVGEFIGQHELDYLYPAAMLTYIVETYGMDKMWEFLSSDDNSQDDQPGTLGAALQATFGISIQDFDQDFQAWLESQDPGEQLEDLRLTVELQDLRRQYQETYVPPPLFLLGQASEAADPDYLPIVIREARAPANIAVELIIANGQQAIIDGDYSTAEELNKLLANIVSTGEFNDPLAKDYLDVVLAAANQGYEVVELEIEGDSATGRVTAEPPILIGMQFHKVDGTWQIQP